MGISSSSKGMVGNAVQVAAGLVVVLVVYNIALWVIQRDNLVQDLAQLKPPKQQLSLLDGYGDASQLADRTWSTINEDAYAYAPVRRSYNRRGGAQFSYTFWLMLTNTAPENVAKKTILLRGDSRRYSWKKVTTSDDVGGGARTDVITDRVLVKCPLIRFGDTYDDIVVEFNTLGDPDSRMEIRGEARPYGDESLRHNALKLVKGKWAMMTFTFEDNASINEFEDGIVVRFYLNDTLYMTKTMAGTFKQNQGDLYLFPSDNGTVAGPTRTKLGNLQYFNYALSTDVIKGLFRAGPPTQAAKDIHGESSEPVYLSEYNKLDIYNT